MKLTFSERMGYRKPRDIIQSDSMDDELRNSLWNIIYGTYFINFLSQDWFKLSFTKNNTQFILIWMEFFNYRIDEIPDKTINGVRKIKEWFFGSEWFRIYDFLEFLIDHVENDNFVPAINRILEEHLSGFRIISNEIVPIISEQDIVSIESALQINKNIAHHINASLKLLSDRPNPDYRNSIKESISAVEALARIITDDPKVTLGAALDEIERTGNIKIHKALKDGFKKLYGWTSDEGGIRHSLIDEPSLYQEDAIYMISSCSAFINYLYSKSLKLGFDFSKK